MGADKTVADFFTPLSKKEPDQMTWRVVNESLLIGRYNVKAGMQLVQPIKAKRKIAAFDFVRRWIEEEEIYLVYA